MKRSHVVVPTVGAFMSLTLSYRIIFRRSRHHLRPESGGELPGLAPRPEPDGPPDDPWQELGNGYQKIRAKMVSVILFMQLFFIGFVFLALAVTIVLSPDGSADTSSARNRRAIGLLTLPDEFALLSLTHDGKVIDPGQAGSGCALAELARTGETVVTYKALQQWRQQHTAQVAPKQLRDTIALIASLVPKRSRHQGGDGGGD